MILRLNYFCIVDLKYGQNIFNETEVKCGA